MSAVATDDQCKREMIDNVSKELDYFNQSYFRDNEKAQVNLYL